MTTSTRASASTQGVTAMTGADFNPFEPIGGRLVSMDKETLSCLIQRCDRFHVESTLFKRELVETTREEVNRLLSLHEWDTVQDCLTFYYWTVPSFGKNSLFLLRKK